MTESQDDSADLKRMRMRAWRRGIKEMDLVLGPFADARLAGLGAEDQALFDALLLENDHDINAWVVGTRPVPERFSALLAQITGFALAGGSRLKG